MNTAPNLAVQIRLAALAAAFPGASICFDALAREQLALDEADCIDKMRAIHAEAIERLRVELARPVYAGKSAEEVQSLLLTETFADGVSLAPAPMSHLWNRLSYLANVPTVADIDKARA